ncbi:MAG: addiction module protein [Bacteroidota bacterium]
MITSEDLKHLSFDDKISMIERIWDSLNPDDREKMPLTTGQKRELDQRLDDYEHGRTKTYSWEEVKAFLKKK